MVWPLRTALQNPVNSHGLNGRVAVAQFATNLLEIEEGRQ
jgi:hypothetical protein